VVVQVGFGLGFYTFVLHGFMRSLPTEVFEAALLDGAQAGRTFWSIVLPLCRPALAALAALATTSNDSPRHTTHGVDARRTRGDTRPDSLI
jgi:multiple sugar transport system permease protein